MHSLPYRLHFSHHFDHPLVDSTTFYVPSVSVTLLLLLLAFAGGFSTSALLRLGEVSSPIKVLTKDSQQMETPFIIYDSGEETSKNKGWVLYQNDIYHFSLRIPTHSESLRFIDHPHTPKDCATPYAVSYLIEYLDISTFDQFKLQTSNRGYQLIDERDIKIDDRASKQFDFQIDDQQIEVYTIIPLKGSTHLIISYLFTAKDEQVSLRQQLVEILATLKIEN